MVTAIKSALPADVQPSPRKTDPLAKSAIDSLMQRQIAQLLLKRDAARTANPRAILEDLDPVSQSKYLDAAIVAIRQVDDEFHVPALYAAVEAGDLFEGGDRIGSMAKEVRLHELERFETALRAYRKFVAADRPADAERFRKLAEADSQ